MYAMTRPWADETVDFDDEVTRQVDLLARSGEHRVDDDVLPLDPFLEEGWEEAETGELSFFLAGDLLAVQRTPQGHRLVSQANGIVKRVFEDRLLLGTPGSSSNEVVLGYRLPASVDLRPLIGRRIDVTLIDEPAGDGSAQTLTVRTRDGRVWLVARCGHLREASHAIGGAVVRATLSPKSGGPLVLAPPELQHIVAPGGEARFRIGESRYVVELVSRDASGCAAYFIADDRLWH